MLGLFAYLIAGIFAEGKKSHEELVINRHLKMKNLDEPWYYDSSGNMRSRNTGDKVKRKYLPGGEMQLIDIYTGKVVYSDNVIKEWAAQELKKRRTQGVKYYHPKWHVTFLDKLDERAPENIRIVYKQGMVLDYNILREVGDDDETSPYFFINTTFKNKVIKFTKYQMIFGDMLEASVPIDELFPEYTAEYKGYSDPDLRSLVALTDFFNIFPTYEQNPNPDIKALKDGAKAITYDTIPVYKKYLYYDIQKDSLHHYYPGHNMFCEDRYIGDLSYEEVDYIEKCINENDGYYFRGEAPYEPHRIRTTDRYEDFEWEKDRFSAWRHSYDDEKWRHARASFRLENSIKSGKYVKKPLVDMDEHMMNLIKAVYPEYETWENKRDYYLEYVLTDEEKARKKEYIKRLKDKNDTTILKDIFQWKIEVAWDCYVEELRMETDTIEKIKEQALQKGVLVRDEVERYFTLVERRFSEGGGKNNPWVYNKPNWAQKCFFKTYWKAVAGWVYYYPSGFDESEYKGKEETFNIPEEYYIPKQTEAE